MCGILGLFDIQNINDQEIESLRRSLVQLSKKQRHRGPDGTGVFAGKKSVLIHERLSIVDIDGGFQPIYSKDKNTLLIANGEIYNHQELRNKYASSYEFQTQSDSEVILALYHLKKEKLFDELRGMFSFIIYNIQTEEYLIARDPIGIIPLFYAYDKHGQFYVSSEAKTLSPSCENIHIFSPGHYYTTEATDLIPYYSPSWQNYDTINTQKSQVDAIQQIKQGLEKSVHSHLMSDVPYGVLLSGGLDSSIIAALAKIYSSKRIESGDTQEAWWPQLHSFSIGLAGSPDIIASEEVAAHIGTIHHSYNFTVEEGLDALEDVIYHVETFDVTTIRASTPMFLLARKIRAMGIKMVLSGEGADEIFGGYLYFHHAPNAQEFHEENVRKLNQLHQYDCLRANKSMAAWGVETRVPFLDQDFLNMAMNLNPKYKMINSEQPIEKYILRQAFKDLLPASITDRQKEQFSDGVGYSWIDELKIYAEKQIDNQMFKKAHFRFPVSTPKTKEAYLYREIFERLFPNRVLTNTVPHADTVACSSEVAYRWLKDQTNDPSGRAVKNIHSDAYKA